MHIQALIWRLLVSAWRVGYSFYRSIFVVEVRWSYHANGYMFQPYFTIEVPRYWAGELRHVCFYVLEQNVMLALQKHPARRWFHKIQHLNKPTGTIRHCSEYSCPCNPNTQRQL